MSNESDVISCYTQRQAIEDGQLVPLSGKDYPATGDAWVPAMVAEAGFRLAIIVTHGVFNDCISPLDESHELAPCQDVKGRMWDLLYMTAFALRRAADSDHCVVTLRVRSNIRKGSGLRGRLETVQLLAELSATDDGEPCVVLMHPSER